MINGSIILLPFSILILNEQRDNGKEKGEKNERYDQSFGRSGFRVQNGY